MFFYQLYDAAATPEKVNITLILRNLGTSGGSITSVYTEIDLETGVEGYWDNIPNTAVPTDRSKVEYNISSIAGNLIEKKSHFNCKLDINQYILFIFSWVQECGNLFSSEISCLLCLIPTFPKPICLRCRITQLSPILTSSYIRETISQYLACLNQEYMSVISLVLTYV